MLVPAGTFVGRQCHQQLRGRALDAPLLRQRLLALLVHHANAAARDAHGVLLVVGGNRPRPLAAVARSAAGRRLFVMRPTTPLPLRLVQPLQVAQQIQSIVLASGAPPAATGIPLLCNVHVLHGREGAAFGTGPEVPRRLPRGVLRKQLPVSLLVQVEVPARVRGRDNASRMKVRAVQGITRAAATWCQVSARPSTGSGPGFGAKPVFLCAMRTADSPRFAHSWLSALTVYAQISNKPS